MTDLIAKLRAAVDEDERVARETIPGPWRASHSGLHVVADEADIMVMENFDAPGPWHRALPHHIARHDPARVLRQVAAMRKILDYADRLDSYQTDNCLVRMPDPQDLVEALAEAYGIEAV